LEHRAALFLRYFWIATSVYGSTGSLKNLFQREPHMYVFRKLATH
jgi:hypothetical protein